MSAKAVNLKYLCFSIISSALCVFLAFNAAGWVYGSFLLSLISVLVFASSSGGLFFSPARVHTMLILFVACILLFQGLTIRRSLQPDLGMPEERIRSIEGRVIYDSSFTQNDNHLMKISLRSCTADNGDRCTSEGMLTVLGSEEQIISCGVGISLKGKFSEGLFIYDELQVTSRSFFNSFRERVITLLKKRILADDDGSALLSCQLLLGRTDEGSFPLMQKARSCGCAHVLALSGMHLGILVGICKAVFGKRRLGKMISLLAVAAFVMTAGPRPSLVRAALGSILFFVGIRQRTFLVLFIQLLVFPQSFTELGCCYGYVAVFAIVHLAPYIEAVLMQYVGRFANLISATLAALLFSAPVQILANGLWCPAAIIASPIAGLLAACSMILGLLELSFGRLTILVKLNGFVYSLMDKLFDTFSRWPRAGWVGYAVFASLVMLLLLFNCWERRKASTDSVIPI